MTNEAMSFEIIQDSEYLKDDFGKAYFDCEMTEKMLIRMAKWKDQQFKEYLEKKKHALDNYSFDELNGAYCVINEIINELFKED